MKPCHKKYAVLVKGHAKGAVLVKLHQKIVIQINVHAVRQNVLVAFKKLQRPLVPAKLRWESFLWLQVKMLHVTYLGYNSSAKTSYSSLFICINTFIS